MSTSPSHFWVRFGLRTAFVVVTVVAIPLGWTAYSLNWIRQRHDYISTEHVLVVRISSGKTPPAPGLLWLFGETGIEILEMIEVGNAIDLKDEIVRAQKLFPEAKIGRWQ